MKPTQTTQVLQWLVTDPEGVYVDCTLGGGGHSAALLSSLGPAARVVGLDRDPAALREASKRLAADVRYLLYVGLDSVGDHRNCGGKNLLYAEISVEKKCV